MRKVLLVVLVAMIAVTSSNAQTKRRITFRMNVPANANLATGINISQYSQFLSTGSAPYIVQASGKSPVFLAAGTPTRTGFDVQLNGSDTSITIKSKTDPDNGFAFTGLYDFPTSIGNVGTVAGMVQFIPPMKGTFVVDTIVMLLFKPTNNGVVVDPVKNNVLLYPVTLNQDVTSFSSIAVPNFDKNLDNFIGDEPIVIKADTINSRVVNNSIKYTILTPKNLTIPAGKSSAFMLRPQSLADSMRWLGVFEWDVKKDTRIYGGYVIRPAAATNDAKDSLIRSINIGYFNPTAAFAAAYPSLVSKGFRTSYSLVLGGMYDGDDDPNETYANASLEATSVEEVGGAQPFAIQSVTPNPMTEAGKMTFSLDRPATVEITIVNSIGQKVGTVANSFMAAGTFSADVDASNLPAGMYSIVLNAGGFRTIAPMSVIR